MTETGESAPGRRRPPVPRGPVGRITRLVTLVDVPGLPPTIGALALLALRWPRLVPRTVRWRAASRGLGLVVARAIESERTQGGGTARLGDTLEAIGSDQGRRLRAALDYGRDPLEVARAVALANRLFDIGARAEPVGPEGAVVITPGCPWSRETWWGPGPCGAFSRYEIGLASGLNANVRLTYEQKRTRGDSRCVGRYEWRPGAAS